MEIQDATGLVFLLLTCLFFPAHGTNSLPGCSFVGDHCLYTVQLGHQNQCDAVTTAAPTSTNDPSCCGAMKQDFGKIKADLLLLNNELKQLTSQVNGTHTDMISQQSQLNATEKQRDALLETLRKKEVELNNTQTELARIIGQAGAEIKSLKEDLTNASDALNTCRIAIGAKSVELPASLSGPVQQTYCNFSSLSDCGYTVTHGQKLFQLMQRGSTSSSGPLADHTIATPGSFYLGLNSYEAASLTTYSTTQAAIVESPTFDPAAFYCIFFWYSMRGPDVVGMDVNIKISGGNGYPVWTKSGDQHDYWSLGQIELDSEYTASPFQIDFIAKTNAYRRYDSRYHTAVKTNEYGDIGIDDVYIYNTTCSNIKKCPPNAYVTLIGNVTSCYTFHETPMSWREAYDTCRRVGPWSALVSVESKDEQDYLVSTINSDQALSTAGQSGFFTSGNDVASEHHFVWTGAGSPYALNFTQGWHSGQPNNVGGRQDCLLLQYAADNYSWGDVDCDSRHPFICEVHKD